MRSWLPRLFLTLAVISPTFASVTLETAHLADLEEDVLGTKKSPSAAVEVLSTANTDEDEEEDDSTVFNGVPVPAMKDFDGERFDEEVKDGYWYENKALQYHSLILRKLSTFKMTALPEHANSRWSGL